MFTEKIQEWKSFFLQNQRRGRELTMATNPMLGQVIQVCHLSGLPPSYKTQPLHTVASLASLFAGGKALSSNTLTST